MEKGYMKVLLNLWHWHTTEARKAMYDYRLEKSNFNRTALGNTANRHSTIAHRIADEIDRTIRADKVKYG
jgi:hypothetical protein